MIIPPVWPGSSSKQKHPPLHLRYSQSSLTFINMSSLITHHTGSILASGYYNTIGFVSSVHRADSRPCQNYGRICILFMREREGLLVLKETIKPAWWQADNHRKLFPIFQFWNFLRLSSIWQGSMVSLSSVLWSNTNCCSSIIGQKVEQHSSPLLKKRVTVVFNYNSLHKPPHWL